jgi:tRNA dimethylallyltransferase
MSSTAASDGAEIRVICGPTAAGKSAIALWLAERADVTIISADSRQVYRRFDIGTAKPSDAEQARVPHRGIDVVEPTERYSAARWREQAEAWIEEARAAGRTPLVVGGTGLYLRALFDGLFEEPPLDDARRRQLEPALADFGLDELRRWATALDPDRAHLGRTQLIRAVEMALLTGHRLSEMHRNRARPARWQARYLLVDPGPPLGAWLAARVDAMFARGWMDEVRALAGSVPDDAPAWKATGYRHVRACVAGEMDERQAREQIVIDTRQYAKRQRTWFRHQLPDDAVTHVDPSSPGWRDVVDAWWTGTSAERSR